MQFATTLVALATLVLVAHAEQFLTSQFVDSQFEQFKYDYSKQYVSEKEESMRKSVFAANLATIMRHNHEATQGLHSYTLGVNAHADLTSAEFVHRFNGYGRGALRWNSAVVDSDVHTEPISDLPDSVDWTTKGVVTPIKDQGQCGSCWAFSAVASIEGQHALKTGKLVSLSEQNLVDCSYAEGDLGCFGGLMDNAFKYVIKNQGIDTEASYPYTATYFELCKYKAANKGSGITKYVDVQSGSESALQSAVATIGPISVAIDASQQSFQLYKSGVYNEPKCSATKLDHGVAAVGYGTATDGTAFWKVKNSWGTSWGEQGYIRMSRNNHNQCGIATNASYPLIE